MSFLPLVPRQTILLLFTRLTSPWYLKRLSGYNHVAMAWYVNDYLFILEPCLSGAVVSLRDVPRGTSWAHVEVLELDLRVEPSPKLLGFGFRTCATVVQYLAGINLGAYLVQTLYYRLTDSDRDVLRAHGIRRVTRWASRHL